MSTAIANQVARFAGKNVLITGGSGGIGMATAERIVDEGGRVLITGTNSTKLEAVKSRLPNVVALVNDAGDPSAAEQLGHIVKTEFGELDGAFLNAGYGNFVPHAEVTSDEFDRQFAVNVRGPILHVKAISALMRPSGSIVINASVARNIGLPGGVIYNSTKGALRTVTRVLALELAERALALDPHYADAYSTIGYARTFQRRPNEAVEAVEKAISLCSNDHGTFHSAAMAHVFAGNFEIARDYEEQADRLSPLDQSESLVDLARANYHLGAFEEARRISALVLVRQPRWMTAQTILVAALWRLGRE